ncbi:MAG: DUF2608 domain-containing protein [bacterium]|nr:DUF2608 domain-containing protein [bacterium]
MDNVFSIYCTKKFSTQSEGTIQDFQKYFYNIGNLDHEIEMPVAYYKCFSNIAAEAREGTLFLGHNNEKGNVLRDFIDEFCKTEEIPHSNLRVIFVEDDKSNLDNLEKYVDDIPVRELVLLHIDWDTDKLLEEVLEPLRDYEVSESLIAHSVNGCAGDERPQA